MIAVIGQVSLIVGLLAASAQGVSPWPRWFARLQFTAVFAAYVILSIAFITNDFSLMYVAQNSHATLPFIYRLTAVWGAHEGSILLWILMLNAWTMTFLFVYKDRAMTVLPTRILGLISAGFLAFLIFTSNPFLTAAWQAGRDLNPLLQDPGFVIHPPILYAGYVGFVLPLALTLSALWQKQLTPEWASMTRRWTAATWALLTLGIALGSWWAYRVLGWGGFWFWDPVENASLLPWLSGVALMHALIIVEKRGQGYRWAALLAILTFSLSLLGTFLVRSGVLVSAHTFANDPKRGIFLLALLAIISGAAFFIYAYRIFSPATTQEHHWLSRETVLWLNSVLFMVVMATILLATLYPLLFDAFNLGAISVGAPYFNKVLLPLVSIILLFMVCAPVLAWQRTTYTALLRGIGVNGVYSVLIAAGCAYWLQQMTALVLIGLSFSIWVILNIIVTRKKNSLGMALAHAGFAVLVIGITLNSASNQDREVRMHTGESVTLGAYQFHFISTEGLQGSNFQGVRGHFVISKGKHIVTDLYPEKRIYTVRDNVMTKVAIAPGVFRDLYIALGEPFGEEEWSVRLYCKPFIRWIGLGALLMALGGLATVWQRKVNT